jgi:arylsulfatase A-like enzyme
MQRIHIILFLIALTSCIGCQSKSNHGRGSAFERPNVLLIMADDAGYGDLGWTGNPVLETPRIDQLASESGSMHRFYVSPVCTPTRAALMTGRNSLRTQAIDTYRGRAMMNTKEITIAEVLRDSGYATSLSGKWHLGDNYPMRPIDQGFDDALHHRGGGLAQPADALDNNRRYTDAILFHNGVEVQTQGFCMDVYTDHAIDFMRKAVDEGRPFFSYVATNTPHGPWHDVPEELYQKYKAKDLSEVLPNPEQADRLARSYAMIENIDQNVGRMLDVLDEMGVADNTIVIYLHDNGPDGIRYVGEMRGMKSNVWEGGIRSPFFVRWPGKVPTLVHEQIAAHMDVWPTIVEATGIAPRVKVEIDGRSIWPLLTDTAQDWPDRKLHMQAHRGDQRIATHHFATVGQRYKLLRDSGFGRETFPVDPAPLALYDLVNDPLEQNDIAAEHPEIVREYLDAYQAWFDRASDYPEWGTPPPIVIDFEAEPVQELNRNDWRIAAGGGYGAGGAWHLQSATDQLLGLRLTTRNAPKKTGAFRAEFLIDGTLIYSLEGKHEQAEQRLDIQIDEAFSFPAGAHALELHLSLNGEAWTPEHLSLMPARKN